MMTSFACLFDRVLDARLDLWLPISDEQSAYQKLKSTLNHIFTIRLLIALAKHCNKPLYIGFFDIAKAFDRVSRLILFKKLIKIGISKCMLRALQLCYTTTSCIVRSGGEYSTPYDKERNQAQNSSFSSSMD